MASRFIFDFHWRLHPQRTPRALRGLDIPFSAGMKKELMNGPNRPDGHEADAGRNDANRPNGGGTEGEKKKAMSSPAAERIYGQHSGYRKLKAYQVAELLYDFTCRFCDRYIAREDRHHDQM